MDYITYQTCIQECSQYADKSVDIARVNQCEDRGVSCGGALSEGAVVSCRSCQSHRTDWYDLVIFGGFLKGLAIYHWVVFFLYTIAIKTSRTWNMEVIWATLLPPLGAFIACAILTSKMALCGVHGLSAYFMLSGVSCIYDIGLGWTLCMGVWWAVFCLGKCVSSGQKACMKATLKLRQALCFAVAKSVLYSESKHTLESARARPSAGTTCSGMGSVHINSMIVDSRSHADVLFSEET